MGTSRGAAYRRFYLYSALSVAVIATAVALAILLHLGLQTAGFGARPLSNEPSRNLSLAIALLAIALPVGTVKSHAHRGRRRLARSLRRTA